MNTHHLSDWQLSVMRISLKEWAQFPKLNTKRGTVCPLFCACQCVNAKYVCYTEGGVIKQTWGSGEPERWNDLTPFRHTVQQFDATSVWSAAPVEVPLSPRISLLSPFFSLHTQTSQTEVLKVFQLNTNNKGKRNSSGGVLHYEAIHNGNTDT